MGVPHHQRVPEVLWTPEIDDQHHNDQHVAMYAVSTSLPTIGSNRQRSIYGLWRQ